MKERAVKVGFKVEDGSSMLQNISRAKELIRAAVWKFEQAHEGLYLLDPVPISTHSSDVEVCNIMNGFLHDGHFKYKIRLVGSNLYIVGLTWSAPRALILPCFSFDTTRTPTMSLVPGINTLNMCGTSATAIDSVVYRTAIDKDGYRRQSHLGAIDVECSNRSPSQYRKVLSSVFEDTNITYVVALKIVNQGRSAAAIHWRRDAKNPSKLVVAAQVDFGIEPLSAQWRDSFNEVLDESQHLPATVEANWQRCDPCNGTESAELDTAGKIDWVAKQWHYGGLYAHSRRPLLRVPAEDLFAPDEGVAAMVHEWDLSEVLWKLILCCSCTA